MNKLRTAILAAACVLPSTGYAATSSGFDSLVSPLPIAVQGTAVLQLSQGFATIVGSEAIMGNLTVDGGVTTHGNVGINTPTATDALDVGGNAVVSGNINATGTISSKGDLTVGEDGTSCDGATAGAMRFDSGSHTMQYCDGSNWQQAGGGAEQGTLCGSIVPNYAHPSFPIYWSTFPPVVDIACQGHNDGSCPSGYYLAQVSQIEAGLYGTIPTYSCVKS